MTREDIRKEIVSQESRAEVADTRVDELRNDEPAKESAVEGARSTGRQTKTGAFIARPKAGEILVYELVEVRNRRKQDTDSRGENQQQEARNHE